MSKLLSGAVLALFLSLGSAFANDGPVRIQLDAQLWTRPLGAENRLKFKNLGTGGKIDTTLTAGGKIVTSSTDVLAPEVTATATFLIVPTTVKVPAYIVTQVRIYNVKTKGLIAECANYDTIGAEHAVGVGVCSGVIGEDQYGLTLSKAN
jgi:hypothetical protein